MSAAELLPCPFCGGHGMRAPSVSSDEATEVDGCRIKCVNDGCPIDGKSFYGAEAYEEAVAWWNRRTPSPAPVSAPATDGEVVEALRAAFEKACYQPGDHPVVPVKIATFMKEVEAALSNPAPGHGEGGACAECGGGAGTIPDRVDGDITCPECGYPPAEKPAKPEDGDV